MCYHNINIPALFSEDVIAEEIHHHCSGRSGRRRSGSDGHLGRSVHVHERSERIGSGV